MEIATDPSLSWETNDILGNLIDGITNDDLLAFDYSWKTNDPLIFSDKDETIATSEFELDKPVNYDWDDSFAPFKLYEHLLKSDTDADEDYAFYVQNQFNTDLDDMHVDFVKNNSPKKKRESPIKHPNGKKSKINQNKLLPWDEKQVSNDLLFDNSPFQYPLSTPIPPLGIAVPTIPENNNEVHENKKVKKKKNKSTSNSNVNSVHSTPKTQRKKRKPKNKNDTEIVITLNKFEEDIEADVIIDFDDESTSEVKTYSDESTFQDDEVFSELKALLKTLGFEGQGWLNKVTIPPTECFELDENEVLDFEKEANSEFFEGNSVKTPDRYLKIRNNILRQWNADRSKYITKTSVRRGLKDCGDVNAIGRIHQFLELIGAINFGLDAPPSCIKQGQPEPIAVLLKKTKNRMSF